MRRRNSSSPEVIAQKISDRKPSPAFCNRRLRRLCSNLRSGRPCNALHFDDGENQEDSAENYHGAKSDDRKEEREWCRKKLEANSVSRQRSNRRYYSKDRSNDRHSDNQSNGRYSDDERNSGRYSDDERNSGRYSDDEQNSGRYSDDEQKSGRYSDDEQNSGRYSDDEQNSGRYSDHATRIDNERFQDDRRRSHNEKSENDRKRNHDERSQDERKLCQLYSMGLCTLGKNCRDDHPGEGIGALKKKVCVYFVRGLCKRTYCPYDHPEADLRHLVEKQAWLKVCQRNKLLTCEKRNCSYLHISEEDVELYVTSRVISAKALGQAIRKALFYNIPISQDKPACKENLDGECTIKNCPFKHLSREDYINAVLSKLLTEFDSEYGPSNCIFPSKEAQKAIIDSLSAPVAVQSNNTIQHQAPFHPQPFGPFPPVWHQGPFPPFPVMGPIPPPMTQAPPSSLPAMGPIPPHIPQAPLPSLPAMGSIPPAPFQAPPPSLPVWHQGPPPPLPVKVPEPQALPPPIIERLHREDEDIDKAMASKLEHANELFLKENKKYLKYIGELTEENEAMLRVLDPNQSYLDLDEARERILCAFEKIDWKSNMKLMDKSLDYHHQTTEHTELSKSNKPQEKSYETRKAIRRKSYEDEVETYLQKCASSEPYERTLIHQSHKESSASSFNQRRLDKKKYLGSSEENYVSAPMDLTDEENSDHDDIYSYEEKISRRTKVDMYAVEHDERRSSWR